jgi:serine phosphatase RsbU (regulator of sigma subunit)
LFRQLSTQGLGADALLQAIKREVEDYRGSSEQFDDLTLLTLRVKSRA